MSFWDALYALESHPRRVPKREPGVGEPAQKTFAGEPGTMAGERLSALIENDYTGLPSVVNGSNVRDSPILFMGFAQSDRPSRPFDYLRPAPCFLGIRARAIDRDERQPRERTPHATDVEMLTTGPQ